MLKSYDAIKTAIRQRPDVKDWIVAFSGGKDSSLVLKLMWSAFAEIKPKGKTLQAIYCDTGSENPLAAALATRFLSDLTAESDNLNVPFHSHILRPEIERRLLVRIVGRGYPPPNTFFRWCTKDLRIRPVQNFLSTISSDAILCLGIRAGESAQRDRSFSLTEQPTYWGSQREGTSNCELFFPIVECTVEDVWDSLHWIQNPKSIDARALWDLYSEASGECPVIRAPQSPPCGSGRFGCWLCTVVRKDKSAIHLIAAGHTNLLPLLEFREWLLSIRNRPSHRTSIRRSGAQGMGPFRLSAREEMLGRIRYAEQQSGLELIDRDEAIAIQNEWEKDRISPRYRED